MSKNEIIEQLFSGKNFRECIDRMEPAHLREDLRSEVILKVCEWPDERVTGLHERGELEFYVARVILNEVRNKYSGFQKKFRQAHLEYRSGESIEVEETTPWRPFIAAEGIPITHIDDIQQREVQELKEDNALRAIEGLYWYDQELVRLYVKLGNYRAIEAETGIPWESAYKSIQKSLKTIRCQVLK